MKYLKRFNESSGQSYEKVRKICEKYNIRNWSINEDGLVDVDDFVDLIGQGLTKLPLKFGRVYSFFACSDNKLTSLEGSPKVVDGDFVCRNNKLTSLIGAPEKVHGCFSCESNQLTSLEGAPTVVGEDFDCGSNKLTSLIGAPKEVGGDFFCNYNKLTTLKGSPEKIVGSFGCPFNNFTTLEGAPKEVGGDFYCSYNKLTSLEGAPTKVGGDREDYRQGDFDCKSNNLTTLKGAPKEVSGDFNCGGNKIYDFPFENGEFFWEAELFFETDSTSGLQSNPIQEIYYIFGESKDEFSKSLDYHYFAGGNKIYKRRFYEALEEQGITPPATLKNYEWT